MGKSHQALAWKVAEFEAHAASLQAQLQERQLLWGRLVCVFFGVLLSLFFGVFILAVLGVFCVCVFLLFVWFWTSGVPNVLDVNPFQMCFVWFLVLFEDFFVGFLRLPFRRPLRCFTYWMLTFPLLADVYKGNMCGSLLTR